jgi:hypothetical protein
VFDFRALYSILYYYSHIFFYFGFFGISCHSIRQASQMCMKILLYLPINIILHFNISIGFWVQSRKEDQILRLDLNPYRVIFKIIHVSTVVVGSRYFRFGILLERVLGTVLRDDRDALLYLHVSRVVG